MPTVLEIIKSTTAYLDKHGVESARLNAEHLIAHALGRKKRLDLYMEFDRPLGESELAPLRPLVRERGQGRPLQHLVGTTEFFGREFRCDPRGLIPRPETEQLVELVLRAPGAKSTILDIGTGSGVIAITLALELPSAEVTAVDLSTDALALARENAAQLAAGITLLQADLLPDETAAFDIIVANLPYIPTGDIPALAREVQHDPVGALDGGADGLDLVRRLVGQGAARLTADGGIFLEVGHDQAERVAGLFAQADYREIAILPDLQGVSRFVAARR